jgi:hypothetical protein
MKNIFTRFLAILLCIFSANAYAQLQVDTVVGTNVKGSSNYKTLAHQLSDRHASDRMKANAIYNWITHNIKYDVKQLKNPKLKPDKVETVMKKRRAVCDGYSKLFTAMCEEVGVKAVTIEGYAKDWMFDNGDQIYIPRHAWNAVYVDGRWQLVEATWGAGYISQEPGWLKKLLSKAAKDPAAATGKLKFKFRYDPSHFLVDPLTFRHKHLPTDPLWQLTDTMMPIVVFEAGDTAINEFNRRYNILVQNLPDLDRINKLDEMDRSQETAGRITEYNPRYRVEMATKYHADALDSLKKAIENRETATQALTVAKAGLKKAEKEIATQKSTIATEYSVLKRKNKTKSLKAKEHIRILHSDNKRLMAGCKSKMNSAESKIKSVKTKAQNANKKHSDFTAKKKGKTNKLKEEDPTSQNLMTIEAAVEKGNEKIASLQEQIDEKTLTIFDNKKANDKRLDSLAICFRVSDSALVKETIARINMRDNYDDEVIKWSAIVKEARLRELDSFQKYFIAGYDTVLNQYEALRKTQWEQVEQYRKNIKEIEKYKRKNSSNTAFLAQYKPTIDAYNESNKEYMDLLSEYADYIQEHKSLFKNIVDLYKRQETLADYMEKSENRRQKLEEQNLAKKEDFDKKENARQRQNIKQTEQKIERFLATKDSKKSGKKKS